MRQLSSISRVLYITTLYIINVIYYIKYWYGRLYYKTQWKNLSLYFTLFLKVEENGGLTEPDRWSTSNWNNVIEAIFKSQLLIDHWGWRSHAQCSISQGQSSWSPAVRAGGCGNHLGHSSFRLGGEPKPRECMRLSHGHTAGLQPAPVKAQNPLRQSWTEATGISQTFSHL